jgi:hypothetical protein
MSGAEAVRLLRERASSYARDAEAAGHASLEDWAALVTVRDELRKVADQIAALDQEAPRSERRCDQCGGLPGRCTDPGGRYWGDCYNPHDCTKSADHTFDRGFFCKVCDRQMLQAEFS